MFGKFGKTTQFKVGFISILLLVGILSFLFAWSPNQASVLTTDTPSPILNVNGITAAVETVPVNHQKDAADDPLIWIHPTDPSLSTVMGNDKNGAYEVYDLNGQRIQRIEIDVANTDIRYNFPLGNERVALVVGYSSTMEGMVAWKVNPSTRMLEDVTAPNAKVKSGGGALYHSTVSGKYYWFSNDKGELFQYQIFDDGSGKVTSSFVRSESFGSKLGEGTVADDVNGYVYVSEEKVGLWRLPAEPDDSSAKYQVDKPVKDGGHFFSGFRGFGDLLHE